MNLRNFSFSPHTDVEGQHSFLSASQYSWIRYSDDKIRSTYENRLAHARGSSLHALAVDLIRMKVKLPQGKKTLNMYVNDAIGWRMTTEQVLFYSYNAFGTADAICFDGKLLRIHDLKTGVTKASFDQLLVYVVYFCLEYDIKPRDIDIELRIYQNDQVYQMFPLLEDIMPIMDRLISANKIIDRMNEEAYS